MIIPLPWLLCVRDQGDRYHGSSTKPLPGVSKGICGVLGVHQGGPFGFPGCNSSIDSDVIEYIIILSPTIQVASDPFPMNKWLRNQKSSQLAAVGVFLSFFLIFILSCVLFSSFSFDAYHGKVAIFLSCRPRLFLGVQDQYFYHLSICPFCPIRPWYFLKTRTAVSIGSNQRAPVHQSAQHRFVWANTNSLRWDARRDYTGDENVK